MEAERNDGQRSLRDSVQVIWRHRLLIFAVVIVAIGGSVAYDVLT